MNIEKIAIHIAWCLEGVNFLSIRKGAINNQQGSQTVDKAQSKAVLYEDGFDRESWNHKPFTKIGASREN